MTQSQQKYVLVGEDESSYARVYKLKLEQEGYEVFIAGNGEVVVAQARKRKPDIILLDLIMPIKDGFWALSEIKNDAKLKNIPLIVTSNLGQEEDIARAKKLGAVDYLVKSSVSIKDIITKIQSYLT